MKNKAIFITAQIPFTRGVTDNRLIDLYSYDPKQINPPSWKVVKSPMLIIFCSIVFPVFPLIIISHFLAKIEKEKQLFIRSLAPSCGSTVCADVSLYSLPIIPLFTRMASNVQAFQPYSLDEEFKDILGSECLSDASEWSRARNVWLTYSVYF